MREMLAALSQKVEHLSQENAKLGSDYANLMEKHAALERSHTDLQGKHEKLENACKQECYALDRRAHKAVVNMENKINGLQNEVGELQHARRFFDNLRKALGASQGISERVISCLSVISLLFSLNRYLRASN